MFQKTRGAVCRGFNCDVVGLFWRNNKYSALYIMRNHTLKRASYGRKKTYRKRGGFNVGYLEREEEVLKKTMILKHKDKSIKELLMIPRGSKISVFKENVDNGSVEVIDESPKSFRFVFLIEGNSTPYYVSDYQILGETAIHALFSTLPLSNNSSSQEELIEPETESEDDLYLTAPSSQKIEETQLVESESPPPPPSESENQTPGQGESSAPEESPVTNPNAPLESPIPSESAEPPVTNPNAQEESPVTNPNAPMESPVPSPSSSEEAPPQEQETKKAEPSFFESFFKPAKTEEKKPSTGIIASLFKTANPTDEKTVQQKSRE
jgi:hypothetical protein